MEVLEVLEVVSCSNDGVEVERAWWRMTMSPLVEIMQECDGPGSS